MQSEPTCHQGEFNHQLNNLRTPGADTGQDPQDPVQGGGDTEGDEFKPTEPKFGGLNKIDSNKWAAWTGGKPKADWTGLETPSPTYINAKQYHPSSISSQSNARLSTIELKG